MIVHRNPLRLLEVAGGVALGIVAAAIAFFVLYWIIRLAVSHALRDHERRMHPPVVTAPPAYPAATAPHPADPTPPQAPAPPPLE
ncbi:hypothetical protein ABCS02_20610 [Microbacterium sp. X-17]|uniref:hypothetical protein n=1 Tax=Microbacterium sp. X-17 TaxID=3144404 RepID=UPI0031F4DFCB